MLSIVLLFGFIETVSGNGTSIYPSVPAVESNSSFIYTSRITTNASFSNSFANNPRGNGSRTTLTSYRTSITTKNTSMTTPFLSSMTPTQIQETGKVTKTSQKYNTRSAITASSMITSSNHLLQTMTEEITISATPVIFIPSSFVEKPGQSVTSLVIISSSSSHLLQKMTQETTISTTPINFLPSSSAARLKTTPTAKTCKNKEKVFAWHVKPATLVDVFYGTFAVALLCIITLIVVFCCWRQQIKEQKKLLRQDTTMFNPYANNHVVGFPSPLQLDTFKPESPYDTPELVESLPDVSYVTVVDGNESDPQYAAVKNGTAQSLGDSESRDDPQPSPAYTNASVFQIEPYQELMAGNRNNEDHYTSLIKPDKNEKNEDDDVSV